MAHDSSSVDRPGIIVTTVLCPYCEGMYPTEDGVVTVCIYCKKPFAVPLADFALDAVRVPVIAKYCQKDPRLCFRVCSPCHKAWLRKQTVEEVEPPQDDPEFWWQKD